jgi:hypothetical protein
MGSGSLGTRPSYVQEVQGDTQPESSAPKVSGYVYSVSYRFTEGMASNAILRFGHKDGSGNPRTI